eukprot:SAG25_NODE_395_length_8553_cov_4.407263_9_plen_111_part_00
MASKWRARRIINIPMIPTTAMTCSVMMDRFQDATVITIKPAPAAPTPTYSVDAPLPLHSVVTQVSATTHLVGPTAILYQPRPLQVGVYHGKRHRRWHEHKRESQPPPPVN